MGVGVGVWGWVIFSYPVSYPVPHVVSSIQVNLVTFVSIDTRPPDLQSESIQFDCTPLSSPVPEGLSKHVNI